VRGRERVVDAGRRPGEVTATTFAERLPVSRQAVVKHLAVLDAAGLGMRFDSEARW
jgi:predicted ArsR family transcriptional regulator